jgi:hypothetical protein
MYSCIRKPMIISKKKQRHLTQKQLRRYLSRSSQGAPGLMVSGSSLGSNEVGKSTSFLMSSGN